MPAPDPDAQDIVYGWMRWNTPLSEDHASLLLERLAIRTGNHVLDLGCGWGELLLRALERVADATGTGVDNDQRLLQRGMQLAADRHLSSRTAFLEMDAPMWERPADRVICIGASHAWGGTAEALQALRRVVRREGRLLFGDGCWEHPPPSPTAAALFGEEVLSLTDLLERVLKAGWRVLHLSTADQREWDDFEATWRAGRQAWLLSNPDDERADKVKEMLDRRLREYVRGYRGVLGFAYLVLAA